MPAAPAGACVVPARPAFLPACLPAPLAACRSALQHGADAASRMSAQVDPAKRYAAAHQAEPAESASGSDSDRGRGVRISEVQQRRSGGGSGRGVPQTPSPVEPGAGLAAALECVGENDKVK